MKKQSGLTVFDRNAREMWEEQGALSAIDAAYQKAIDITQTHKPTVLPDGAEEEISKIVEHYQAERI